MVDVTPPPRPARFPPDASAQWEDVARWAKDIDVWAGLIWTRTGGGVDAIYSTITTKNADYTFRLGDEQAKYFHDEVTARSWVIPDNATVPFAIGTTIKLINNNGAGNISLSITTDTLRRGDGTAGTGTRTIGADRIATITKTKTTEWMIEGSFT